MKNAKIITIYTLAILMASVFTGCEKKADETRPIDQVKTEAEGMDADQLRTMALQYKDAIMAKTNDVDNLVGRLKEIPVAKMMTDETKELKTEIDNLTESLSALRKRFEVYYDKLKEQGGDLSGLEI